MDQCDMKQFSEACTGWKEAFIYKKNLHGNQTSA